jgi:prephenate dehydrogenase
VSRAAVVGLGLIGGSIALAGVAKGWDRDASTRARARERGIDARESLEEALAGVSLVFLAVPTREVVAMLPSVAALAERGAVLTDAASRKRPVLDAAQELPAGTRFVGGHPLAGSERKGIDAASSALFRGRPWVLVPSDLVDADAVGRVSAAVLSFGARPMEMRADRHDELMTRITSLPLAVAAALVRTAGPSDSDDLARLAGPGLLDTTRLAGSPAELTEELTLGDPHALADAIERVQGDLLRISRSLRELDHEAVRAFFAEARTARGRLGSGL